MPERDLRLAASDQLLDLAAAITGEQTVEEILDDVFVHLRPLVPFDRIEFATVDDDGRTLHTRWVRAGYEDVRLDVGYRYCRPADAPPFSAAEGPFLEIDITESARGKPGWHPVRLLAAEGIRASLSCPLTARGELVGFLFFGSKKRGTYDEIHLWMIGRIGQIIAGAVRWSRLQEELANRNVELEELSRLRTRDVATISHELRTPLTGVFGLASALRDNLDAIDPAEAHSLVAMIAEQACDAAGIVEDLLVVARAEAGQLAVVAEDVDVGVEVRSAISAMGVDVPVSGSSPLAKGDRARVRQIVRNLLTNARRYGGPCVRVEMDGEGPWVAVTVVDDGEGIPEADRESVFRPFETSVQRDGASIGLGLWVSRQLADLMGGALDYHYRDKESRFTLRLPAATG